MSAEFTRGSWVVTPLGRSITAIQTIPGPSGQARQHRVSVAKQIGNPSDASLIACAPELYEALRVMVEDFADYPASERPCRAFDLANAALAKAVLR